MEELSKAELKEPEIRSEEVQEVLGQVPPWILRWGITVMLCIVLVLFAGSWFFKYPDTIEAPIIITSYSPPAHVNARANGKITHLLVSEKQEVQSGDYLAVIENPANIDDIFSVKRQLPDWQNLISDGSYRYNKEICKVKYELGDIQQYYLNFIRAVDNYLLFRNLNYYPKRIEAIEEQIRKQQEYVSKLQNQYGVVEEQYALNRSKYARDSLLNTKDAVPDAQLETSAINLLQSRHSVESSKIAIDNAHLQIDQLGQTILDLQLQELEKKSQLQSEIKNGFDNLMNGFNTWEMAYILKSPVEGRVDISNYWSVNQNIVAGETIFTILPNDENLLVGKAQLPIAGSGKVKAGQKVNISFLNYPDHEYGIVHGVVNNISVVPSGESYIVDVGLPHGLTTTYGKTLVFTQEMHATAEIITDDLRLLERLFSPLKKIFSEQKMQEQK